MSEPIQWLCPPLGMGVRGSRLGIRGEPAFSNDVFWMSKTTAPDFNDV